MKDLVSLVGILPMSVMTWLNIASSSVVVSWHSVSGK